MGGLGLEESDRLKLQEEMDEIVPSSYSESEHKGKEGSQAAALQTRGTKKKQ